MALTLLVALGSANQTQGCVHFPSGPLRRQKGPGPLPAAEVTSSPSFSLAVRVESPFPASFASRWDSGLSSHLRRGENPGEHLPRPHSPPPGGLGWKPGSLPAALQSISVNLPERGPDRRPSAWRGFGKNKAHIHLLVRGTLVTTTFEPILEMMYSGLVGTPGLRC